MTCNTLVSLEKLIFSLKWGKSVQIDFYAHFKLFKLLLLSADFRICWNFKGGQFFLLRNVQKQKLS